MAFTSTLNRAVKQSGLSVTAAAQKIGISAPSLYAALNGDSLPNQRTIGKYAKFLGLKSDKLAKSIEREKANGTGHGSKRKRTKGRGKTRSKDAPSARERRLARELGTALKQIDKLKTRLEATLKELN